MIIVISKLQCQSKVITESQRKKIDNTRKECMRLADKAVDQYKIAKSCAAKRQEGAYYMNNFEEECKRIKTKLPDDRTIGEMAKLKQYEDENWREQFEYSYDYEDDCSF